MKVMVVSDGTIHGTKISDENGNVIKATSVTFTQKVGEMPRFEIDVVEQRKVEIEGEAYVVVKPFNDCETFDGYQKLTLVTREYPMCGDNLVYPSLKLSGESGELADKIGKHWRNKAKEYRQGKKLYGLGSSELHAMAAVSYSEDEKQAALKELGDVLWYIAAIATEFGVPLSEVARMNIAKTHDRKDRGVICSEGDSR